VAFGTDNIDAQLGDGLPAEVVLGFPRATIDQAASAPLVLTISGDIKDELPVLYLRLKAAVQDNGLQLVELTSQRGGMSPYAARTLTYRPGELSGLVEAIAGHGPIDGPVAGVEPAAIEDVRAHMTRAWEKGRPGSPQIVVVLGRPSLAESDREVARAAATLAALPAVAFLPALRRSNVHGALDLGLAPGVLPGRVALEDGHAWYEYQWNATLPEERGLDTAGILAAAARGRIGGLVLVGADPLGDFPDATAALKGLEGARFVVAVDTHRNPSNRRADVVLPAATYAERRGTFTNMEGRITWLGQMVTAPGVAWADWMIASELVAAMGGDLGFTSLEDVWAEVERVSPLHAGARYDLITSRQGRDGVVVPVDPAAGASPRPRPLDPMADPGIASAEVHTTPPTSLMVAGSGVNRTDAPRTNGATARADDTADEDVPKRPGRLGPPAAPEVGAADGREGLRLVVRRTLWDGGTLVQSAPALSSLHPEPAVRVHPDELDRLGIRPGASVRVRSSHGSVTVPAVPDPGLAPGAAAIAFNLPGAHPSALIDAAAPLTTVRLEPREEAATDG
ncbi:MAG: molybdopterin-dependent oxidoreductase, partial [Acidimicrobiaceae bacterium]|nr:molybdopterin-dependent oxidoreductase [Acidimicrobiaceae bacterium]